MPATRVQCSLAPRSTSDTGLPRVRLLIALAISLLSAPAATEKPSAAILFEQAQACEKASDLAGAERLYRRVIASDPRSAEAFANLGVVIAKQQRFAEAIQYYRSALRLKPSLVALHLNLGLALLKAGQATDAVPEFHAYLERAPSDLRARQLLATSLLESDQYEQAATEFEKLLPSDDSSIRLALATAYVKLNRKAEAEKLFSSVLSDDASPAVRLAVGQAYLAANELEQARNEVEHALSTDPKLPGAHFTLAGIYWKQQQAGKAVDHWRRELALDPSHFEANFALGAALVESRNLRDAEPFLIKARHLRPQHAPTLYYLGRLYWRLNRPSAAALVERSVQLDPANRGARFLLSQIYKAQGKTQAAREQLAALEALSRKQVQEDIDLFQKARQ